MRLVTLFLLILTILIPDESWSRTPNTSIWMVSENSSLINSHNYNKRHQFQNYSNLFRYQRITKKAVPYWMQAIGDWWYQVYPQNPDNYNGSLKSQMEHEIKQEFITPSTDFNQGVGLNWRRNFELGNCTPCFMKNPIRKYVHYSGSWWGSTNARVFFQSPQKILCVRVFHRPEGRMDSADATAVSGGPSFHHFVLDVSSLIWRNIRFEVYIHTHCEDFRRYHSNYVEEQKRSRGWLQTYKKNRVQGSNNSEDNKIRMLSNSDEEDMSIFSDVSSES